MGVFSLGKVVLGSLFKKPSTLMYPVIPREWEEKTRGAVGIHIDGCILCGACGRACPTGAITVDRKASTWSIERMNCVQCKGCVDNCPPNCLFMEQKYTEPGGEKVVDTFNIPPKKKAPKKDAPAKADAPKPDAAKAKTEAPQADAPAAEKAAPAAAAPAAASAPAAEGGLQCDVGSCIFCSACAEACPVSAIEVGDDSWKVDKDTCIECGACVDQCPAGCLSMAEAAPATEPAAPAAEGAEAAPVEAAAAASASEAALEAEAADAPARAAGEQEAAPAAPVDKPLKPVPHAASPEQAAYLADVKAILMQEHGLNEAEAEAKLNKACLADQLRAFPYLMKREAREAAAKVK